MEGTMKGCVTQSRNQHRVKGRKGRAKEGPLHVKTPGLLFLGHTADLLHVLALSSGGHLAFL